MSVQVYFNHFLKQIKIKYCLSGSKTNADAPEDPAQSELAKIMYRTLFDDDMQDLKRILLSHGGDKTVDTSKIEDKFNKIRKRIFNHIGSIASNILQKKPQQTQVIGNRFLEIPKLLRSTAMNVLSLFDKSANQNSQNIHTRSDTDDSPIIRERASFANAEANSVNERRLFENTVKNMIDKFLDPQFLTKIMKLIASFLLGLSSAIVSSAMAYFAEGATRDEVFQQFLKQLGKLLKDLIVVGY